MVLQQPLPDRTLGQFVAVHTIGVIQILQSKGFTVEWRFNRYGAPRFRVGGGSCPRHVSREMTPLEMSERYRDYL